MRKLIVSNIMSLDGYYEGPGKNVMVLPLDEAFDAYNAERLRAADTLLLGRVSYDGFRGLENRRNRGRIPLASSGVLMRTPRLPNSNAKPAKTSWSLAAAHSGTTCWPMVWLTNST